ncbi:hypothetical protein HZB07_07690 [Candidatus Saganbacteria bacterium]|nr:hypothetical protein [Candidatus Saganbacteria bacterium]
MKKIIGLVTVFAFVVAISGMVFAQADGRAPAEKLESAKSYLKLLDQKIIRLRKAGKMSLVAKMQADKKSTLARMQQWKAEAEASMAMPPQVPTRPTAPTPMLPTPPRPVSQAPAGLFGLGVNTCVSGSYIYTGTGSIKGAGAVRGDIVLDDFVGLGPIVGLSAKAIQYKLGIGYVKGSGVTALPVYADGVINLPADMMMGMETYLTGGLNYTVKGSGADPGKIGGEIAIGLNTDLGLGLGKTGFELGWSVVRATSKTAKGITISVSQPIAL